MALTGVWVVFYVGLLTLTGAADGASAAGTWYFASLLVGAAAWFASIVIVSILPTRTGFWVSTIPLVLAAAIAVLSMVDARVFLESGSGS